uniref:Uncharacterized protein n=1 Tax=Cannabis sativa TaxID=3483 RepID=A0A803Q936_CANSA
MIRGVEEVEELFAEEIDAESELAEFMDGVLDCEDEFEEDGGKIICGGDIGGVVGVGEKFETTGVETTSDV